MKKNFCGILVIEKEHAVARGFIGLCLLTMVLANTNAALGAIITNITATASSYSENQGPEKAIDGSGLNESGGHSTVFTHMWLSSREDENPYIQYEFDSVYSLEEMHVWNSNQLLEEVLGFGAKDVTIDVSTDGDDWTPLMTVQFNQALGQPDYMYNTTIVFGGVAARMVKLNINDNWSPFFRQRGLSEVQFFDDTPVVVNEPPVANAGADQEVISSNGINAPVTLDGSQSYDPDEGDTLTSYSWREGVTVIAIGVNPTITLPVGPHTIELIVNDGDVDSEPDTVEINVITASRAAENLSDLLNELEPPLPTETVSALATSLEAAIKSFDKGNTGAGVNQLQAFQNKVNAQRGKKIDAETAAEIISLAQDIMDAAEG